MILHSANENYLIGNQMISKYATITFCIYKISWESTNCLVEKRKRLLYLNCVDAVVMMSVVCASSSRCLGWSILSDCDS